MSDTSMPQDLPPPSSEPENKLTSDQFDEFKEALEVLYVLANMSGRLNFAKNWPAAGEHVLGAELMEYDREGTSDKERRAELEQQAEERRIALLELMDTLEAKSVEKGALQVDYVREVIERLGREISLLIYGAQIVDRFIAPPPPPPPEAETGEGDGEAGIESGGAGEVAPNVPSGASTEQPSAPEAAPQQTPQQAEMPAAPVVPDSLEDVKPIDMSAPSQPPAQSATPAAQPSQQEQPAQPPVSPTPVAPSEPEASPVSQKVQGKVEIKPASPEDKKESGEGSPPPSE